MMRARGAAMIESVVVLGVVLTVMFGTFEIGLIGLTQLSSDGAAFLAAHASVMGDSPTGVIATPFPMLNVNADPTNPNTPAVVTISTSAPDPVSEPVDYQIANQSNRHGGAQVLRPSHSQASVTQSKVGIGLIMPFMTGGSGFIEGNETVSDDGFDLAGTGLNSASGEAGEVNYFADDGNTPPYFIGFRFLWHCNQWFYSNNNCTNSNMASVGLAELLDGTNWNEPVNGTNGPTAVFYAMLLHQQVYSHIAQSIKNFDAQSFNVYQVSGTNGYKYYTSDAMELLDPTTQQNTTSPTVIFTNASTGVVGHNAGQHATLPSCYLQTVYAWDSSVPPGYAIGSGGFGAHPLNTTYVAPNCIVP